ncbi:hypothetical protein GCK72_001575 [Caenorhabditis remanei]|uniref:F-box associated domain-containing protein n=1 Tax=Caenorhabditis remanei TaxID=31234 RepID=A0A6A5HPB7_CAERE|nr:hypothetical protein GCK72_001575 [Caenorhabditis remanei]KAF1769758.1 hypothetical protein GCK72_001575 [Caenorhabditis remanei]
MSKFPLFQLPGVPRTLVFQLMDPEQVIELTFIYRAIKETVSLSKLRASHFLLLLHNPPCNSIKIVIQFSENSINFTLIAKIEYSEEAFSSWEIDGNPVHGQKLNKTNFSLFFGKTYSDQELVVKSLTQHFHEIMRFNDYSFRAIQVSLKSIMSNFIWKHTKKFRDFVYYQNEIDTSATSKELKFLLEEITVNQLELRLKPEIHPTISKLKLKHSTMQLDYSLSIHFDSYFDMKCEKVWITVSIVNSEDIVNFVRNWLDRNLENLQFFSVEIRNDVFDEDFIFSKFKQFMIEFPPDHPKHNTRPNIRDIKQSSGKSARLSFYLKKFEFEVE